MTKATIFRSAALFMGVVLFSGFSASLSAQNVTFEEEFIFFIDGANVEIPINDGTTVVDPLNPDGTNNVYRINYGGWAEAGFRFNNGAPEANGADFTDMIGSEYGESDTLFFRMLSDTANGAPGRTGNSFVALFDTDTGINYEEDNLPFRLRWTIPTWAHDGQWHEFALPLPPALSATLDSIKAGVNSTGDSLQVEVDSLFSLWDYPGAWSNPGIGGATGGTFVGKGDAKYTDFDWASVKYVGVHWDYDESAVGGGGPIYFDDFYIGTSATSLESTPPAATSEVTIEGVDGSHSITWGSVSGAAAYNIYFSESAITSVTADGVTKVGTVTADGVLSFTNTIEVPHPSLASDLTSHYAVTAVSGLGAESAPTTSSIEGNVSFLSSYAYELSDDEITTVLEAIAGETIPDAATLAGLFPDGYVPFTIDQDRFYLENGTAPDDNADLSSKTWLAFGSTNQELIVYAEISDEAYQFPAVETGAGAAWAYDSFEMGLGNYSPESFIEGSTHNDMLRGDNPDYQFRGGSFADGVGYIHESWFLNSEIPNSQTIVEETDYGYRTLTLVNTVNLSGTGTVSPNADPDVAFDFPAGTEVKTYPFNFALNDSDDANGARERQISWSNKAGGDGWWNTPSKWQVIAFVGKDASVSNEEDGTNSSQPLTFSLEQNYPNPFNPSTNINFTLPGATQVTLEVYNMLGQKVATLINNESMAVGSHSHTFDASNLSSGLYIYRISTGSSFVQAKKMMLIK